MATKIFISYRRDDAKYEARDIYKALRGVMPDENVFMDVDSIPLGANFRHILNGWVDQCDVLLALIGPDWLDAGDANSGQRRLDSPNDFVRIEISEALKRGIPVVPVLLDGARLPDAARLPDDLKELIDRQAHFIAFRTIDEDVARLITKLGLSDDGQDGQTSASPAPPQPSTHEHSTSAREPAPSPAPAAESAHPASATRTAVDQKKEKNWTLIAVYWLFLSLFIIFRMAVLFDDLNWSFLGGGDEQQSDSGLAIGVALSLAPAAWILRRRGAAASGTEWAIYWLGISLTGTPVIAGLFDNFNWSFRKFGLDDTGTSGFLVCLVLSLKAAEWIFYRHGAKASVTEWAIYFLGTSIIGGATMVGLFKTASDIGAFIGLPLGLAAAGYFNWRRWQNRHQK